MQAPRRTTEDWVLAKVALSCLAIALGTAGLSAMGVEPAGVGRYRMKGAATNKASVVREFVWSRGERESTPAGEGRWWSLHAWKGGGGEYRLWMFCRGDGAATSLGARGEVERYVLQEGAGEAVECRDRWTGRAVLPSVVGWEVLWPGAEAGGGAGYLGHRYERDETAGPIGGTEGSRPPESRVVELQPEVLVGLPSNTRQKDERRRYDGSDYELVRLQEADYREMVAAGMTCLRVDREQLPWVERLNAFYWGVGGADVPYPECLYRPQYLGPTLFLDEPAVGTRDLVLRPRLQKVPAFRGEITAERAFEAFREHYDEVLRDGPPTVLRKWLAGRADVDLGTLGATLRQRNLYSWETMVATATHQLMRDPEVPDAMVFEPPGRLGTLRTLPEMNLSYGCQIPPDVPANFTAILYGFLRGAARQTGKAWGTSIYGAVDRQDAFWFMTRAYDLGATRFFFWDNAALACVPYGECLALARNLRNHVENRPHRDLARLRHAAEVALILPAGYDLGHVMMGRGNLWGLGELNLERTNSVGVTYRRVMGNAFTEIERSLRLGVAFDLLWDLPGVDPRGYREVVRIRQDGGVDVLADGRTVNLPGARIPARPEGAPPTLEVEVAVPTEPAPVNARATAVAVETSAPIWYTLGADEKGIHRNAAVAWELYGPQPEDHRFLITPTPAPRVVRRGNTYESKVTFALARPGTYRLRVATTDLAGRSTVRWVPLEVAATRSDVDAK